MIKRTKQITIFTTITAMILSFFVIGCDVGSNQSNPKDVVIDLFAAMENDDKAALAHILDLSSLMKNILKDYALSGGDEPRVFRNPQDILNDLTGDGETKTRWFSLQRLVNLVEIDGEMATVEVTFVDKDESKGYMTKFGLQIVNGKWKIYSFNVLPTTED